MHQGNGIYSLRTWGEGRHFCNSFLEDLILLQQLSTQPIKDPTRGIQLVHLCHHIIILGEGGDTSDKQECACGVARELEAVGKESPSLIAGRTQRTVPSSPGTKMRLIWTIQPDPPRSSTPMMDMVA